MKNLVVIGGGTGNFVVLSGLRKLKNVSLTAIVDSTDSGGSTGRLRDEFGFLPVGDVRQCLVALAGEKQQLLRELFLYRFDRGEQGLKGHNLGNLFLTALRDIVGNELEAIKLTQKLFDIKGNVYPVTLSDCHLVAEYENGEVQISEGNIDAPPYPHDSNLRITNLVTKPEAKTYKEVEEAIKRADMIIISPGDLYTSLLANFVVKGVPEAMKKSKATVVYIMNLMTKFGQTNGFSAKDHVDELEKYIGRKIDHVLTNDNHLPEKILNKYVRQNSSPVLDDMKNDPRALRTTLVALEEVKTSKGDILQRSLIRHDPKKIANEIKKLLSQPS